MVERRDGAYVEAEVVGFHQGILCLMPITDTQGLSPGARVIPQTETHKILWVPACSVGCSMALASRWTSSGR